VLTRAYRPNPALHHTPHSTLPQTYRPGKISLRNYQQLPRPLKNITIPVDKNPTKKKERGYNYCETFNAQRCIYARQGNFNRDIFARQGNSKRQGKSNAGS